MKYFVDFDRTIFDTESFKKAFARHATARELWLQFVATIKEFFSGTRTLPKRRIATRTLGTYASHGRFGFTPAELKLYLYPDALTFLEAHGPDTTIVTYGVRAFITAKVTSALTDIHVRDVVYTHQKKGRTIRRLTEKEDELCVFVDDAQFQLRSVTRACPSVACIEIRRDGASGAGTWPVIRSFDELSAALTPS